MQLVASVLDEAGINYLSVSGRTKSVASFAEKATRSADGVRLYADPLREIGDQLGVRVITYVRDDVDAVAELLADQVVVTDDRDLGRETASEGRFGYASRHLQIMIDAAREGQPAYAHLAGRNVQVQIRTVLQHAWAEFEHDIRYKGTVPPSTPTTSTAASPWRPDCWSWPTRSSPRSATGCAGRSRTPTTSRRSRPTTTRVSTPRELAAFLAGQYADAGWSRSDHYAWVSGLLLELGITSLDELGDVLRATDEASIRERMDYRYPPGAVRRLDDALLATYGETYVALHGNAHRAAALRARLDKLTGTLGSPRGHPDHAEHPDRRLRRPRRRAGPDPERRLDPRGRDGQPLRPEPDLRADHGRGAGQAHRPSDRRAPDDHRRRPQRRGVRRGRRRQRDLPRRGGGRAGPAGARDPPARVRARAWR